MLGRVGAFLLFFKKIFFLLRLLQKEGYTLIELLTTVGVVGTLTVIGIKSYQTQTNKARSAEAKHSLSYVYTVEKNFKDSWGTYHENLMSIGAIPSGSYHYDVGFGKSAAISDIDGFLESYPLRVSLNLQECTSFYQICEGDCMNKAKTTVAAIDPTFSVYFDITDTTYGGGSNCRVTGNLYIKDYTISEGCAATKSGATGSCFRAIAMGKLKGDDVWSIDERRVVTHEVDGTQ